MEDITYHNYLSELLENHNINSSYNNYLKLDLYLTLLSLNNNNYQEKKYLAEINIIENFLRKVNNLKVKIQLKRKDEEINELLNDIKYIYEQNKKTIDKYNKENIDLIDIIESKEPTNITSAIDKLTKIKIAKLEKKTTYDILRNQIINTIFTTAYYLDNDNLYIGDNITVPLNELYEIFDYLLDLDNYKDIYHNEIANNERKNIITSIIDNLNSNKELTNYLPIILTSLFNKNNLDYEDIDTSKFNIDNIKISELYSFANSNLIDDNKTAKWKKVLIPNSYLYQKIKEMINNGMYYFQNDIFIMEVINDFKISITTGDLITFIKENIDKLANKQTIHI